jgi:hypothetical protein
MTVEIGTVGRCKATPNDVIVIATHEHYLWVKDTMGNQVCTTHVSDFTENKPKPKLFHLGLDIPLVELTVEVSAILRNAGVQFETSDQFLN